MQNRPEPRRVPRDYSPQELYVLESTLRPTRERKFRPTGHTTPLPTPSPLLAILGVAMVLGPMVAVLGALSWLYGEPDTSGLELERAADLAECQKEARYVDARAQLRVDGWATDHCMKRRGWPVEPRNPRDG